MLPDKKEWAKEFIGSARYKEVVEALHNLPDPEFIPTWDVRRVNHNIHKRHWFYLIRTLPLQSFYILDYISKNTSGDEIVNLTEGFNFFEGMFNVVSWKSDMSVNQSNTFSVHDLYYHPKRQFNNTFCICGYHVIGFDRMREIIHSVKKATKNYGYIAFDSFEMLRSTDPNFMARHELNKYYRLNMFIDDLVDELSEEADIISYENLIQLEPEFPDNSTDPVDGDIRILFKTKPSAKA